MGRGRQMSTCNNFGPYHLIFMLLALQSHAVRNVEAATGPWLSVPSSSPTTTSPTPVQCDIYYQYLHSSKKFCCNKCFAGFYLGQECPGKGMESICVRCRNGTYSDSVNSYKHCRRCNPCQANEEMKKPCTDKQNTVCECKKGYYKHILIREEYQCHACKKCGSGEKETQPCTAETNTKCECEDGYYRDQGNPSTCKKCDVGNKEQNLLCPTISTPVSEIKSTQAPAQHLFVAVPVTIVGTSLLLGLIWLCHKVTRSRWTQEKRPLSISEPPSSPCESVTSTKALLPVVATIKKVYTENAPILNNTQCETQNALPDCVPPEIKTNKFIYSVLEVVPVSRITELVRQLGVKDQDIERARRDHPISCQEAQYHMLKRWADSGMRPGSVTLSRQLMQQILDTLRDMGLGGCAESLEMEYDPEPA